MNGPFAIDANEVESLDDDRLTSLLNSGADAITDGQGKQSSFLPSGLEVWQYKRRFPSFKRLESELRSGAFAQEMFAKGAGCERRK